MKLKRPKLYMLLYRIMETSPNQTGKNPENSFRFPHGHPSSHEGILKNHLAAITGTL